MTTNRLWTERLSVMVGLLSTIASLPVAPSLAAAEGSSFNFNMVRSPALSSSCVPNGSASVRFQDAGPVQVMTVKVTGLPPNTDFDLFVIQVPNKPFGMSWYQGDIETNRKGTGKVTFIGRFSIETFVVAPGSAPAPVTFNGPFPDASLNPTTNPIQMYHLGLWFNSPTDAANAGCPNAVTPFNGPHDAGVQLLITSNFPDLEGPLKNVQ